MMHSSRQRLSLAARSLLRAPNLLFIAAMLAWSGCATGDYAYQTRISTGEKIQIMLVRGNPEHAKQGTIEIVYAGMRPGLSPDKKQMIYLFALMEKSGKAPQSIRVEDVSDEKAALIMEDLHPVLIEKVKWAGESKPLSAFDPALHWATYVDDAMRVFRFTIVDSEGKTIVLNQGWFVPSWAKPGLRKMIGMDEVK